MRNRLGLVLCILCGSFFVYCGQAVMTNMGHGAHDGGAGGGAGSGTSDGPVGDAMAQSSGGGTCCAAPPRETPTVIFDDILKPGAPIASNSSYCPMYSPVFDISGFRTVVIHGACGFSAQVRNGKAGFVLGANSDCSSADTGRVLTIDPILGHDLRINYGNPTTTDPDSYTACSTRPTGVTIVGYRNP